MISIKKLFPAFVIIILSLLFLDYLNGHQERILFNLAATITILLLLMFGYSKRNTIAKFDTTKQKVLDTEEVPFRKIFRFRYQYLIYMALLVWAGFVVLIWLGNDSIPEKTVFTTLFGITAIYTAINITRAKLVLSNTGIEHYTALGKISSSWDNVSEIIKRHTGDDVLILKSESFIGLWKSKVSSYEIPLTSFDIDWRTREIGKIISKYAPLQFLEE